RLIEDARILRRLGLLGDRGGHGRIAVGRLGGVVGTGRRDRARPQRLPQKGHPQLRGGPPVVRPAGQEGELSTRRLPGLRLDQGARLLDRHLYLPEDWVDDPVRREECHVPPDVTYRKTWEIAHDL